MEYYNKIFLTNLEEYTKELNDYKQFEKEKAEALQLEFEQRMLNEQLINSYGIK